MSIYSASQRTRLTPEERVRLGQLVVAIIHDTVTDEQHEEIRLLKEKMGPKEDDFEPIE